LPPTVSGGPLTEVGAKSNESEVNRAEDAPPDELAHESELMSPGAPAFTGTVVTWVISLARAGLGGAGG
jgi:hypothetical protein